MSNIIKIGGVRGYVDKDGMAWLNAEDVAKGFGFTDVREGKEYVRWARVNEYLNSFGFSPQVAKDDFIPENMVYRLGFKANNEVAQGFQAELADEILPTIRRTGSYNAKPMTTGELLMQYTQAYLEQERRMAQIEVTQSKQEQRLLEVESKQMTIDKNHYTIIGYANLMGINGVNREVAANLGRKASRLSNKQNYHIGKEYDAKYGAVNTYHVDILQEIFRSSF